jgi:16S rRNA (guanine527-N7)-methyltransferase
MTSEIPLSPEKFEEIAIVSRETMVRLRAYADHLAEWQQTLNLVSRNSLDNVWDRHMLDSIQLIRHLPEGATAITDIGSGAGFPGLVLAIATGLPTRLIESHVRKSAFLR